MSASSSNYTYVNVFKGSDGWYVGATCTDGTIARFSDFYLSLFDAHYECVRQNEMLAEGELNDRFDDAQDDRNAGLASELDAWEAPLVEMGGYRHDG